MIDPKEKIETLKSLVKICRDAQENFREAAEKITEPDIRAFFHEKSLERANFAGEIENELHRLGEKDVDQSGSLGGSVHRGFTALKSAVGGGEQALLDEAERGEDVSKQAYEKAINSKHLTQEVMAIVYRQYQAIVPSHDRVKQFRDRKRAA
jgi:uncharacterized protein (TIGR02284 family)